MANNLTIRDARIIFPNFSGKATNYTPEGRRTFSVLIDDEDMANALIQDGWNVKMLRKRNPDDPQHYHIPVAIFYGNYPPSVTMISGNTKTVLDESTIQLLDWADIEKVDLTIRPRSYEAAGRKGIKAYLKTMYVTVQEDELAAEYAYLDTPYSNETDASF